MHYNNCDVVILMHKRNAKKRSWHSYGTPGAGANFLITHSEIDKLWQENIYNFEGNKMTIVLVISSLMLQMNYPKEPLMVRLVLWDNC